MPVEMVMMLSAMMRPWIMNPRQNIKYTNDQTSQGMKKLRRFSLIPCNFASIFSSRVQHVLPKWRSYFKCRNMEGPALSSVTENRMYTKLSEAMTIRNASVTCLFSQSKCLSSMCLHSAIRATSINRAIPVAQVFSIANIFFYLEILWKIASNEPTATLVLSEVCNLILHRIRLSISNPSN